MSGLTNAMRTKSRKRRSRNSHVSQRLINRRMREMWIDGFGLLPEVPSEKQLAQTRLALQRLAADDAFWNKLGQLITLKQKAETFRNELKQEL